MAENIDVSRTSNHSLSSLLLIHNKSKQLAKEDSQNYLPNDFYHHDLSEKEKRSIFHTRDLPMSDYDRKKLEKESAKEAEEKIKKEYDEYLMKLMPENHAPVMRPSYIGGKPRQLTQLEIEAKKKNVERFEILEPKHSKKKKKEEEDRYEDYFDCM